MRHKTDSEIRQPRDLPVDGKKLVNRQPLNKNNTRSGTKKGNDHSLSLRVLKKSKA